MKKTKKLKYKDFVAGENYSPDELLTAAPFRLEPSILHKVFPNMGAYAVDSTRNNEDGAVDLYLAEFPLRFFQENAKTTPNQEQIVFLRGGAFFVIESWGKVQFYARAKRDTYHIEFFINVWSCLNLLNTEPASWR